MSLSAISKVALGYMRKVEVEMLLQMWFVPCTLKRTSDLVSAGLLRRRMSQTIALRLGLICAIW